MQSLRSIYFNGKESGSTEPAPRIGSGDPPVFQQEIACGCPRYGRLKSGERREEYSTERDLTGGSGYNWRWWCGGRYSDGDGEIPVAIRS